MSLASPKLVEGVLQLASHGMQVDTALKLLVSSFDFMANCASGCGSFRQAAD